MGTGEWVQLSTCDDADFDTKIDVFTGSCGELVCVAGNDDGAGCTDYTSAFGFQTVEGEMYYIYVSGFTITGEGTSTGNFTLSVCPYCDITGLSLDPYYDPAGGLFCAGDGTYYVSFRLDGVEFNALPRNEDGTVNVGDWRVVIDGLDYPIVGAGFDNITVPGITYFYLEVMEVPGEAAEDVEVYVELKDDCTFTVYDMYDEPDCGWCDITGMSLYSYVCNDDNTYDACFEVEGVYLPDSAFADLKLVIDHIEMPVSAYYQEDGKWFVCAEGINDFGNNIESFFKVRDLCTWTFYYDAPDAACGKASRTATFANNEIQVYPNPTSGTLNIRSADVDQAKMTILNTVGQVVYRTDISANELKSVDMSKFGSGLYIVRILGQNKRFEKKVVVE